MARQSFRMLLLLACLAGCGSAQAQVQTQAQTQTQPGVLRGELLYSTHCLSCHSTQLHWRDNQVAQNWFGLKAEVRRWQIATGLSWSEEDITEVATYLNTRFYQFPPSDAGRVSAGNVDFSR